MRMQVLIASMALLLSSCSGALDAITQMGETTLQKAVKSCASDYSGYIDVLDDGKTLNIDGEGKESDGSPIKETACVLYAIPVPSYVISRMDQTRALDGVQREQFDAFDISWSYHPDNGLDIVIHEQ